jgi:hypothetical protein
MLKKKLIRQQSQPQTIAKPDRELGKLASKNRTEPDIEGEDQDLDEEEPQEPQETPKPRLLPKKKLTPVAKKKGSLGAALGSVPLTNNAKGVPEGNHEAIITEFVIQKPDHKGQSVRIKFELVDPEFAEGGKNVITGWYKLMGTKESLDEPNEGGMRAFKMALAKLGYDPDELDESEDPEQAYLDVLDEIERDKRGVIVKISYDPSYPEYPRTRIEDGEADTELIQAYKDNIPY